MSCMKLSALLLVLISANQAQNPCTNGSFEEIGPAGFPVDWSPVGEHVEVCSDARSGTRALRIARAASSAFAETGLNRNWRPESGEQGAMLDRVRGGIEFWYKAVSAKNAEMVVCVIPMNSLPLEVAGPGRTLFKIPAEHIGDGRWHSARMKYDYSDSPEVKWVHVGARITGEQGELILDDFSYLEQVGPILSIDRLRLEEDAAYPGTRCVLNARLANEGDAPASNVRAIVQLEFPVAANEPGAAPQRPVTRRFDIQPAEIRVGDLPPDSHSNVKWEIRGRRDEPSTFAVRATADNAEAASSYRIEVLFEVVSFGPCSPAAAAGRPAHLECLVKNTGHTVILGPQAEFQVSGKQLTDRGKSIPPGGSVKLGVTVVPKQQRTDFPVSVRVTAANAQEIFSAESRIVVGAPVQAPEPTNRLNAQSLDECALLENERVRLVFPRADFGFGMGEMWTLCRGQWTRVACMPASARVVFRDTFGTRTEHLGYAERPRASRTSHDGALLFDWSFRDTSGGAWKGVTEFHLAPDSCFIEVRSRVVCDVERELLCFEGPLIYVLERDEAIFPGLEWLVEEEVSSSTLDIQAGHPDQVRYVVHPNMITVPAIGVHSPSGTVGLLWDARQRWDGVRDRPSAVFASPDRFEHQRAHLMGLFVPSVPEHVPVNSREAATPYPLPANAPLDLRSHIVVDGAASDALVALDYWFSLYGYPEPALIPRGSYEREIEFSMRGYLESLWVPETKQWWTTKNGHPLMSYKARPNAFVADLLRGATITSDAELRERCMGRVEEVLAIEGGAPRIDAQLHPDRVDLGWLNLAGVSAILASRRPDGTWRFDADEEPGGVFEGVDYHTLGPDDALEVGTCAAKAYQVLRYVRISGDWDVHEAMAPTLERMRQFRVPRVAQVWEVPVHTPDILAAADATEAYLEAYRFSNDPRWLESAVVWARRGFPFIYAWDDYDLPFLVGASIPVFGASFHSYSWFGRPVQWNGLNYANAILKLAEYDQTYPWKRIAEVVIRSALHQQDAEGENAALWPDNVSALTGEKCPWVFPPRQIIQNLLTLLGRPEEPRTTIVGSGRERIHLTACAAIRAAEWVADELAVCLEFPPGNQGALLICNIARPRAVELDGKTIPEREDIEKRDEPGWRYNSGLACATVRIHHDGEAHVRFHGARFRRVSRLPLPVDRIDFDFEHGTDGWLPFNDIEAFDSRDGRIVGSLTGPDPYLVRSALQVAGDDSPRIRVRMRLTNGHQAQFYWTTMNSPQFGEDKVVLFDVMPDGHFHEYLLDLNKHLLWGGQTITGIRLDPCNGVKDGMFEMDSVRAEPYRR